MGLGLNINLGLGSRGSGSDAGELPATFSIAAGFANAGAKYINFSEPVTVTITGNVTLSIGSTVYNSGDTIPKATGDYHKLTINNPGAAPGTITFGKRKQITYLNLDALGSSVITSDITGMKLTFLRLAALGSSVITGKITGMGLAAMYIQGLGSGISLSYGTNLFNITHTYGIQLLSNPVFATAAEYEQLIMDAATGTWSPVGSRPFKIDAGTNENCPDWDTVKAAVAVLRGKAAWTIIPAAWLTTGGGSWPADWKEYEG